MYKKILLITTLLFIATPLWAQLVRPPIESDVDEPPVFQSQDNISHDPYKLTDKEKKAVGEARQIIRENHAEELDELRADYQEDEQEINDEMLEELKKAQGDMADEYLDEQTKLQKQEGAALKGMTDKKKRKKIAKEYRKKRRNLKIGFKTERVATSALWLKKKRQSKKDLKDGYHKARKSAKFNYRLNIQKNRTTPEYKTIINTHDI